MFRSSRTSTSSRARVARRPCLAGERLESRALLAGDDHGHSGDLHVHVEGSTLSTEHGAYGWEFVDEGGGYVADIGFDADDQPQGSSLRLVPRTNLLYWNGNGRVPSFALMTGSSTLKLEGTGSQITLGDVQGLGEFVTIGRAEEGVVHDHIAAALGTAPEGVYAFYASVESSAADLLGPTKPIAFVLNRGVDERIHERAVEALEDRPLVVTAIPSTPNGTLRAGQVIDVAVTFSEAVVVRGRPQLALDIGGTNRSAVHVGHDAQTRTSTFRYTVSSRDPVDADGIGIGRTLRFVAGSSIRAADGGAAALAVIPRIDGSGIRIDTSLPRVTRIEASAPGTYTAGQVLQFIVSFSKPVVVTGTPSLRFVTSGGTRFAGGPAFVSGSDSQRLTFSYTVQPTDVARNGVALRRAFSLLGNAAILDAVGNQAIAGNGIVAFPGVRVRPSPVAS